MNDDEFTKLRNDIIRAGNNAVRNAQKENLKRAFLTYIIKTANCITNFPMERLRPIRPQYINKVLNLRNRKRLTLECRL